MSTPLSFGERPVENDRISTEALFARFGNKLDDVLSITDPAVSKCLIALLAKDHVRLDSGIVRITMRMLIKLGVAGMTTQDIRRVFTDDVERSERK